MQLCLFRVLEEKGRDGVKGTPISGVRAGRRGLEERAAGKLLVGAFEVCSGAVGAVPGVAEDHLGYSKREGLGSIRVVQYGRIQGDYQL